MGLYNMMITSTSGMAAQTNWLGTISDNIANAQTTGYKEVDAQFSTLVVNGGVGEYNSGGVSTSTRYNITGQGVLDYTTSTTDLAVKGNGFFVVSNTAGNTLLTRAGSFVVASDGTLVNAGGFTLMGYAINGGVTSQTLADIDTSSLALQAELSTQGALSMNLPSTAAIPSTAYNVPGDTTSGVNTALLPSANPAADVYYTNKTSITAYGDEGAAIPLDVYSTKTGLNTWEVSVYNSTQSTGGTFPYVDSTGTQVTPLATTTLTFDASVGTITAGTTSLSIPLATNSSAITLSVAKTTQLAAPFSVVSSVMNGHSASAFDHLAVSTGGVISAVYTNGVEQNVFQVPLANVASPDNLTVLTGNVFQANTNSGNVFFDTPGVGAMGAIVSGALEESTGDIASQLTKMIVAQRDYTANSAVFKTGSELLDTLNNMVR
jgi:flagellar hook protein FlgE